MLKHQYLHFGDFNIFMSNSKNNLVGIAYVYEVNHFRIARISVFSKYLNKITQTKENWFQLIDEPFLHDTISAISEHDQSEIVSCHLIQLELVHTGQINESWSVFFVNQAYFVEDLFNKPGKCSALNFSKISETHLPQVISIMKGYLSEYAPEPPWDNFFHLEEEIDPSKRINTEIDINSELNQEERKINPHKGKVLPLNSLIGTITFMNNTILIRNFEFAQNQRIIFQVNAIDAKYLSEIHSFVKKIPFNLYFPTFTGNSQQILEQKMEGELISLQKIRSDDFQAIFHYFE